MSIEKQIDVLIKGRVLLLKIVEDLSLNQINSIPQGHNNTIGWNVGHVLVTQQLLCYQFSGVKTKISDDLIKKYRKGTNARGLVIDEQEWESIKNDLLKFPKELLEDYNNGLFKEYTEYKTSVNVVLDSIEKAVDFNNFHEGVHVGIVLSQKKLV